MDDLKTLTTPERTGEGRYRWRMREGWEQGRSAFGGLVLAAMARAIEDASGAPDRTLRSLTATLCGPVVPGETEIRVEPLRIGKAMSTLSARLVQGDGVMAQVVAVLGQRRIPDLLTVPSMRALGLPWREVPVVDLGPPLAPAFTQYFEYRPTGPLPFSGLAEARTGGWLRPKAPGPLRDGPYLVAMADAWWPAIFTTMDEPRPTATVQFTIDLPGTWGPIDPDTPLFLAEQVVAARDGYLVEFRELVGADGRILALNEQTVVVIK